MNSAYKLLNKDLRKYIYDAGWDALHPVQAMAIKQSVNTDHNFILAAPTASGKTEAAFLPAINAVKNFKDGVKIVYVSPLVALINDQFKRLFTLCGDMDIAVTRWHGEASYTQKKKLLKKPEGIVLITPESLEAMLTLRPGEATSLFRHTEWIIIDEIHSFMSSNRGIQLKSLLERLKHYHQSAPRYIGMSATLNKNDYIYAKDFFSSTRKTDVILDNTKNRFLKTINYYPNDMRGQSTGAIDRIFDYSQTESMLVFPNARAEVERIAVGLKKKAEKTGSHTAYFAHHASLTKDARHFAETFAKESKNQLFTICCTSTLELGIDIGAVDSVVQYNAPFSVSSLAQRLGRSGRKTRESKLHLMTTDDWSLLQGVAAVELFLEGKLEATKIVAKPLDVFAHQMLALLLERSGISIQKLYRLHHYFKIFSAITDDECERLVDFLIEMEYIELLDDLAIVGVAAEPLLKGSEFFAHFITESNYAVYSKDKRVGELPRTPSVQVGINIFLAARIWRIDAIEPKTKKIFVSPAKDGRPPVFLGSGSEVSDDIRRRMQLVLFTPSIWETYSESPREAIAKLNANHKNNAKHIYAEDGNGILLRTFKGTLINRTLHLMMNIVTNSTDYKLDDHSTAIMGPDIQKVVQHLTKNPLGKTDVEIFLSDHLNLVESMLVHNKYAKLLPVYLKTSYVIDVFLDVDGANKYLRGGDYDH